MNFASTKELQKLLYIKLKLPVIEKTKTGISTATWVLEKLENQHPIIPLLLRYRKLSKLRNTYTDAWLECIHPKTGRIHADIMSTGTQTGRISMRNPNFQQIPKTNADFIRKAIVSEEGYTLAEIDFSQMDLRILAHHSEDPELMKAFNENIDLHDYTAKLINADRHVAKAINFGIVYGKQAESLSEDLNISLEEAKVFIRKWFYKYWRVRQWQRKVAEMTTINGYVTTFYGRRRSIPEINNNNPYKRSAAQRMAWASICSGGTAEITKMAMIAVAKILPSDCKMLLQIHDAILLEIPDSSVNDIVPKIVNIMENCYKLKVPIKANASVGKSLGEMKPWN